jgi:hypothetical protein
MDKDLPLVLFPDFSEFDQNDFKSTITDLNEFLNIKFDQPIDAVYDDEAEQVKCFSNRYQSKYNLNRLTPMLPWNMPEKCSLIGD